MKRRDMFKGLLGLFALGAPALASTRPKLTGKEQAFVDAYSAAQQAGYETPLQQLLEECGSKFITIHWQPMTDEIPEGDDVEYLVRSDGQISTMSRKRLLWLFNIYEDRKASEGHWNGAPNPITYWSRVPKELKEDREALMQEFDRLGIV